MRQFSPTLPGAAVLLIKDGVTILEKGYGLANVELSVPAHNLAGRPYFHRALQMRAAAHGHSADAEVRAILTLAVKLHAPVRKGDALAAAGRKIGLASDDVATTERARDRTPADPFTFT